MPPAGYPAPSYGPAQPVPPATQPPPDQAGPAEPAWAYTVPETERRNAALFIAGIATAAAGGIAAVIGIPLAATATETLNVCFQSTCQAVEVTDTTQRDVGIGLAIGGGLVLAGGVVMALVGGELVEIQPADQAPTSWLPELLIHPAGGDARWWF